MIAFLRGTLQLREIGGGPTDKLILEVAGVGFDLLVSRATAAQAGQVGDEVTVFTSLVIRENEWVMYGFASPTEKEMFLLLQSVTGVGPKLALGLVGSLGPQTIAEAIETEDQKLLSSAPGVGNKVAQRIILELSAKIAAWRAKGTVGEVSALPRTSAREDARNILEGLGYTLSEITVAMKQINPDAEDVEEIVRATLKSLGTLGQAEA